jgi:hypothetical protein
MLMLPFHTDRSHFFSIMCIIFDTSALKNFIPDIFVKIILSRVLVSNNAGCGLDERVYYSYTSPVITRNYSVIAPVTVAERSKACTVFARSEAGIVASNPTQGMDV